MLKFYELMKMYVINNIKGFTMYKKIEKRLLDNFVTNSKYIINIKCDNYSDYFRNKNMVLDKIIYFIKKHTKNNSRVFIDIDRKFRDLEIIILIVDDEKIKTKITVTQIVIS